MKSIAPPVVMVAVVLASAMRGAGQEPPPVMGTIALEGTVDKTYAAANAVLVKASDGIGHLFHITKRTVVHGGNDAGEPLDGLAEGGRVVVHYTMDGDEKTAVEVDRLGDDGLREIKGVITHVDRKARTLSIRLADGSTEVLQLSERAAKDVGKDVDATAAEGANVVVYYTTETGDKVAHYFKKIS